MEGSNDAGGDAEKNSLKFAKHSQLLPRVENDKIVETNLEEHAEHGDLSHVALPPPPLLSGQSHTSWSGKGAHAAMLV